MNDSVIITSVIVLAVLVVVIVVVLAILLYNQMLLTNEVNKRLLVMTKDSIDHERGTQEQLNEAISELERVSNEQTGFTPQNLEDGGDESSEEIFDPHTYTDEHPE